MIRPTITIAWPRCLRLISVLRLVGGRRADHDVVRGDLLDERREGDEVVDDRDLQRRVVVRRVGRAAGAVAVTPDLPAGRVLETGREQLGSRGWIRFGDVDPALVRR